MKAIEAVIFDCDGVVVDSDKLQRDAEQQTVPLFAKEHGLNYDFADIDWGSMQGWARKKIAATVFSVPVESELATDFMLAVVDTTVEIASDENLALVPGVAAFIDYLALRSIHRGLATSSNRRIYSRYCEVNDMDFFPPHFVVAHGECGANKPEPAPYLEVMRRMGVSPERTLVVEDTSAGITAGRRAGAVVLGLATTNSREYLLRETGAHFAADDFEQAAGLIQGLLPR